MHLASTRGRRTRWSAGRSRCPRTGRDRSGCSSSPRRSRPPGAAGAVEAGSDEPIKKVGDGWMDFDVAVAHPSVMGRQARPGPGRRARCRPRSPGTVTPDVQGGHRARGGKIEYRNDKGGNIHAVVGKQSFADADLQANARGTRGGTSAGPSRRRAGQFIRCVCLSGTMTPSVTVEVVEAFGPPGDRPGSGVWRGPGYGDWMRATTMSKTVKRLMINEYADRYGTPANACIVNAIADRAVATNQRAWPAARKGSTPPGAQECPKCKVFEGTRSNRWAGDGRALRDHHRDRTAIDSAKVPLPGYRRIFPDRVEGGDPDGDAGTDRRGPSWARMKGRAER